MKRPAFRTTGAAVVVGVGWGCIVTGTAVSAEGEGTVAGVERGATAGAAVAAVVDETVTMCSAGGLSSLVDAIVGADAIKELTALSSSSKSMSFIFSLPCLQLL
jgi:hypothetical protein